MSKFRQTVDAWLASDAITWLVAIVFAVAFAVACYYGHPRDVIVVAWVCWASLKIRHNDEAIAVYRAQQLDDRKEIETISRYQKTRREK